MLISIIIPFYNSKDFIERSLRSCLDQRFSNIEIILIDDGSTDGSSLIVSRFCGEDSRVRLLSQENSGASAARNKGLEAAAGEYVMFLDSDDTIDPDMIEDLLEVVKDNPEIQVVQTMVPNDMKHQAVEGIYSSEQSVKCLLEGSWWGPVCKLIKREVIGDIRFPDKTISEDYLFNYLLFSVIDSLYYKDKCYYHRTDRPDSLSKIPLSKRTFDEYYNIKAVSDMVSAEHPYYQSLADSHLAGTCLKLLFSIFHNKKEKQYHHELEVILDCIRSKYGSFIKNPHISLKERILLSACFSEGCAKLSERMYSLYNMLLG